MSNRRSPWLTFVTILVYAFLYAPVVVLVVYAFNSSKINIVFQGFVNKGPCGPFYWFCGLLDNREMLAAAQNTLFIAFTSSLVATVIGTMAALALQRYAFPAKTFSEVSLYIPIVIPEIVMGIGILVLFSAVFRWVNTTLGLEGSERLSMNLWTVIVSHIAFSVPFVTLVVRARLHGFDKAVEEAAMDLGANEWRTFWRVTLPILAPGVLAGGLLAFTLSLDDFVITFFTTGPGATTLPIYIYGLLRRNPSPEINALSTLWITLVLIALLVSQRLQRRET